MTPHGRALDSRLEDLTRRLTERWRDREAFDLSSEGLAGASETTSHGVLGDSENAGDFSSSWPVLGPSVSLRLIAPVFCGSVDTAGGRHSLPAFIARASNALPKLGRRRGQPIEEVVVRGQRPTTGQMIFVKLDAGFDRQWLERALQHVAPVAPQDEVNFQFEFDCTEGGDERTWRRMDTAELADRIFRLEQRLRNVTDPDLRRAMLWAIDFWQDKLDTLYDLRNAFPGN